MRFIEIIDYGGYITTINKDFIVYLKPYIGEDTDGTIVGFTQAGHTSPYEIVANVRYEEFKRLLNE